MSDSIGGNRLSGYNFMKMNGQIVTAAGHLPSSFEVIKAPCLLHCGVSCTVGSLALWGLLHCGVSCTVNLLISGLLKGCVTQSSERQTAPLPLFTGSKTYMEQNGQKAVAGSWQPLPVGYSLR